MRDRTPGQAKLQAVSQYQRARRRMVETSLGTAGARDPVLRGAFERVPRDQFVHQEALRLQAYEDVALPIGLGQTLSAPSTQAKMTAALEIGKDHRVLEIGTGSGYQTAILAELAGKVFTIERHRELADRAMRLLRELGYKTILARVGDGTLGWTERAPFDRILVTACAPGALGPLLAQLGPDGILVTPQAGAHGGQRLVRVRKGNSGACQAEDLGPCQFVPLIGAAGYRPRVQTRMSHLNFATEGC